jgi:hypothetical protein
VRTALGCSIFPADGIGRAQKHRLETTRPQLAAHRKSRGSSVLAERYNSASQRQGRLRLPPEFRQAPSRVEAASGLKSIPFGALWRVTVFNSPTRAKVVFCLGADQSEAAMIRKVSNVEIVVPTVFAIALVIVLSIGAVYLAEIFLGPIEQVEAHQSGSR